MCTDCISEQRWKKCFRNWNGDCPAAHGENPTGADHYTVAHWGMLCWKQVEMPRRKLYRQIPVPCERTVIQISLFLKDCTTWRGPMLEQLPKNCSPLETDHLSSSSCIIPWKRPHTGAGEQCREEGAVTGVMNWLGTCHSLSPLNHSWQRNRRVRNEGVKAESVKKCRVGRGVFRFLTMLIKVAVNLLKPTLFCLWC